MSMRKIQKNVLPSNWINTIKYFDIEKSPLRGNTKILVSKMTSYIIDEKEQALTSYFIQPIIDYIFFNVYFSVPYEDIPEKLFIEALEEINGEKGFNFTRKLHSIFVEFITYQKLIDYGFQIDNYTRSEGSCDLIMSKNNQIHNFEVKFKENRDTSTSRYFDYIDGMSYVEENLFLRNKTFEIHLKIDGANYKEEKFILKEIDTFVNKKKEIFEGEYIEIFSTDNRRKKSRDVHKVTNYLNSFYISDELTKSDNIEALIKKLFIDNNGHITKMSNKANNFENFHGCLAWSIPFHKTIDLEKVKNEFNKLELNFDLYVLLSGIRQDECDFIVKSKCIVAPGRETAKLSSKLSILVKQILYTIHNIYRKILRKN